MQLIMQPFKRCNKISRIAQIFTWILHIPQMSFWLYNMNVYLIFDQLQDEPLFDTWGFVLDCSLQHLIYSSFVLSRM
jgi:hypothetical protein